MTKKFSRTKSLIVWLSFFTTYSRAKPVYC